MKITRDGYRMPCIFALIFSWIRFPALVVVNPSVKMLDIWVVETVQLVL